MAIGIYLSFNPELHAVHLASDGKLLAMHLDTLDHVARVAKVPPLTAFMDQREPGEEDFDLDAFMASWADWFAPADGIRTVEGLLAVLRGPDCPVRLTEDAVYLPHQLEDVLRCLRLAEAQGSQFRIEVGM
jgi:hypothetical protein